MTLLIGNAAELRDEEVVPSIAVFQRSGGSEWQVPCSWSGNDFYVNLPVSSVGFTDDLKLVRIIGSSAHGNREIWP